jgi:hypothetical protein
MTGASLEFLTFASLIALAALAIRMVFLGLHRIFPFFFTFTVLDLVLGCAYPIFGLDSAAYFNVFRIGGLLYAIGQITVARELFTQLQRENPGFKALSRRACIVAACVGLACLAIGLSLTARRWRQDDFQCFTFACWELLRLSAFWVVAYVATMTRSLRRVGIRLPQNHRTIAIAFCLQIGIEALCNTLAASFQLYRSPWLDSLNLLDATIQIVAVTTCIAKLTSHRKLTIEGARIPDWFPRLLAFAPVLQCLSEEARAQSTPWLVTFLLGGHRRSERKKQYANRRSDSTTLPRYDPRDVHSLSIER